MAYYVRFAVGILGNISSLLRYAVPIITFRRVIKNKSTEEFSAVPYVVTLLNCLLYTWYGLPLISHGSDNILVVTVNGIGVVLCCFFLCIYLIFAPPMAKRSVARMCVAVLVFFGTLVAVSLFVFHDKRRRKMVVGTVAVVVSVAMYGSPLSVIRLVIRTKSVEFMPFFLSFFTFVSSGMWLLYGVLGQDIFIVVPNLLGLPLGVAQLVMYFVYRNKKCQSSLPNEKLDPETGLRLNGIPLDGTKPNITKLYVEECVEVNQLSNPNINKDEDHTP
eukprot:Gb_02874 [translate_table: standard]